MHLHLLCLFATRYLLNVIDALKQFLLMKGFFEVTAFSVTN